MSLPKTEYITFEVSLPSTGQKLKMRVFTVAEKKILAHARLSDDLNEIDNATKQVINNCILAPSNLDVMDLPIYDVDYVYLQLNARSIGESRTFIFNPIIETDCSLCSKPKEVVVDLLDVKVEKVAGHDKKIQLNEKLGVVMKEPTFAILSQIRETKKSLDFSLILTTMAKCIAFVYDSNQMYDTKDVTVEEVEAFLEGLTFQEYEKIDHFFETLPTLKHVINLDCAECGRKEEYVIKEMKDFFS